MPRHHVQHMRNVGSILFVCNENIAHVMPTAHVMMSCTHAGKPATLCICGAPGITYGRAVRAS